MFCQQPQEFLNGMCNLQALLLSAAFHPHRLRLGIQIQRFGAGLAVAYDRCTIRARVRVVDNRGFEELARPRLLANEVPLLSPCTLTRRLGQQTGHLTRVLTPTSTADLPLCPSSCPAFSNKHHRPSERLGQCLRTYLSSSPDPAWKACCRCTSKASSLGQEGITRTPFGSGASRNGASTFMSRTVPVTWGSSVPLVWFRWSSRCVVNWISAADFLVGHRGSAVSRLGMHSGCRKWQPVYRAAVLTGAGKTRCVSYSTFTGTIDRKCARMSISK